MITLSPVSRLITFILIFLSVAGGLFSCNSTPPETHIFTSTLTSTVQTNNLTPSPTPSIVKTTITETEIIETATSSIKLILTPSPGPTETKKTQEPTCWEYGGRSEDHTLRTNLLPLPLEYKIYFPPCYDESPNSSYPVLYLIHGQNYNHNQWERLGAFETADGLMRSGETPPFIIVLPRDRNWAQPTEDLFGRVLTEELVPHIDRNYRTIDDRLFRAVGGLSRGAGWAVHLGLSSWELFGKIGAHSLPVFWTDTQHIRSWLDDIPIKSLPDIYIDIGENDRPQILASAQWFEEILTEKNIPHEWYLNTGYHEEAYWQSHIEEYLRWYAADWLNEIVY